ncbi:MAG: M48 family metallopeptidase [Candidatus Omnitrophica bacterium]|nr:M48 family metallopeptidase [Candidatus Omnitrophota bacterium]
MKADSSSAAQRYARLKRRGMFLEAGLTFLFLCAVLTSGLAGKVSEWVSGLLGPWPLQVALTAGILWLGLTGLSFPLDWYRSFWIEHRFGLSNLTLSGWIRETLKQWGLSSLLGLFMVEGLWALIRFTGESWWIWAALAWVAWSSLLTRVAPVLLIPLFYRQKPLSDPSLQERLEGLLDRCNLKVHGIFEVNLSKTTRKANACLCGLGKTRRVLLSDTLVGAHPAEEVEVVLAHEMGHHELHHLTLLMGIGSAATAAACFLVDRILRRGGPSWGFQGLSDLSTLPAIALGLWIAGWILLPITNGISRFLERQADRFALEKTRNPAAFIAAMKRLAEENLAEGSPPRWVEWLLYDHPPIPKRIALAEEGGAAR